MIHGVIDANHAFPILIWICLVWGIKKAFNGLVLITWDASSLIQEKAGHLI
jgi:hypothetical protein